jgi:hypothetical protein
MTTNNFISNSKNSFMMHNIPLAIFYEKAKYHLSGLTITFISFYLHFPGRNPNVSFFSQSNPGQVSLQAKALADIMPSIINQARDAIATTKDISAKAEIIKATKELILASKLMIESAKNGDQVKLNEAFKLTSEAIPRFIAAIKKGATAENQVSSSLEKIRTEVTKLNNQTIFAQAGQLDISDRDPNFSLDDLVAATNAVGRSIIESAEATKVGVDAFGASAQNLSSAVLKMSESSIKVSTTIFSSRLGFGSHKNFWVDRIVRSKTHSPLYYLNMHDAQIPNLKAHESFHNHLSADIAYFCFFFLIRSTFFASPIWLTFV